MRLDRIIRSSIFPLAFLLFSPLCASPEDPRILKEVRQSLSQSAELRAGSRLMARSEEGILTISGFAQTLYQLEEARRLAASVRGVVDVVISARVARGKIPDMQIRNALNLALAPAARSIHELRAQVGRGKVVLTGRAGSYGQKREVQETVSRVRGIASIVNRIEVTASTNADGFALGRRVHRKILEDLRSRPSKLHVKVDDGKALLRGRVPLYLHRIQAETAALSVPGVSQVENRLLVDPNLTSLASNPQ